MANLKKQIWLIHECEGPHVVIAFTEEPDARNYFNHACANQELSPQWYTVSPVTLEDMSKQAEAH